MSDYRVLVTGSRTWTNVAFISDVLDEVLAPRLTGFTLVHGAAHKGADYIAMQWAASRTPKGLITLEPHPADWKANRKGAGPIRNAEMVALGADVCLAFIRTYSRGATHCASLAEKAGIETRIYRWEEVMAS